MGKPLEYVSVRDGYRLWAATYDRDPNPLLALEERVAAPLLGTLNGVRVIDLCAGTGRWTSIAASMRAKVIGFDISPEMLHRAAERTALTGRLAVADVARLPVRSGSADLAICSFGISYVRPLERAFCELARIARRVMVSDMHPAALEAGWTRSFETSTRKFRIAHYKHSLATIEAAAYAAGLRPELSIECRFGEPERRLFAEAGRNHAFAEVASIPAVFIKLWG